MEPIEIKTTNRGIQKPISNQINIVRLVVLLVLLVSVSLAAVWYFVFQKRNQTVTIKAPVNIDQAFSSATSGKDSTGKELSIAERTQAFQDAATGLASRVSSNPNDTASLEKLAGAYYNLENLDGAIETFNKLMVLDPNNALLHNNLANVLRDSGKYPEAETHYLKSIELDPTLAVPYFNYAVMLGGLENKKDEAIKVLEEGLIKNPENETLKNLLGEYQKT